MHLKCPTQKTNTKTHLKKQNFMFNKKEQLFNTHLFSILLVHPTPSTHGALVVIHLYDPLGKKIRVKKCSFFIIEQIVIFQTKKRQGKKKTKKNYSLKNLLFFLKLFFAG
jgi:hypothetical protein